jgi:hypothetical protein
MELSNSEDLEERNLMDEAETGVREKGCMDIGSGGSVRGPVVGLMNTVMGVKFPKSRNVLMI